MAPSKRESWRTLSLDRNIFETPIKELYKTKVLLTLVDGKVVFDRKEEIDELAVVEVEITNSDLDNAVDAAELNVLVADELAATGKRCCGMTCQIGPLGSGAPDTVVQAFGALLDDGYRYARPAREIMWKDEGKFWIQWTLKSDGTAVLWAYDPEAKKAVEILRVKQKPEDANASASR